MGVAFTVAVYGPGLFPSPTGAQEVLDAFDAAGVTSSVNRIIGGHGFGYATLADIQAAAAG